MNGAKGVAVVLRRFLPSMVARGSGAIVNVTHVLDPPQGANVASYQASRAAISALTRCVAAELPPGMHAVEIDPGALLGLRGTEKEGADVGPTRRPGFDETACDWARAAVPFVLGLTREVNGCSVHVPGWGSLGGDVHAPHHRVPE